MTTEEFKKLSDATIRRYKSENPVPIKWLDALEEYLTSLQKRMNEEG